MNYQMRRQGEDLGVYSLDELRHRRQAGELTGGEYVQEEGKSDWQPLDLVLQQGYRVVPPPLPPSASRSGPGQGVVWVIIAGVGIFFVLFITFFFYLALNLQRGIQTGINSSRAQRSWSPPSTEGVSVASKPVMWTTNTLTERRRSEKGAANSGSANGWKAMKIRGRREPGAVIAEARPVHPRVD